MKNDKEKVSIPIHSYQNIWNYEKLVYTFLDKKLGTPIKLWDFVYLLVIGIVNIGINLLFKIPNFGVFGFIFKYFVLPFILMRMVKYQKLDGKNPIMFAKDYIIFFITKNKQYEFFRVVAPEPNEYILNWKCSYRHRLWLSPKRRGKT